MLRLHFPTGDLIIDHRSALAPVRDLHCLASEDEVRRLLLLALNNPTALDRLRRFFAQWNSEAWRVNVIKDRRLIERVARMTVNGPLAAFVVHQMPALNTTHVAARLAIGNPALKAPAAGGPSLAGNATTLAPGGVAAPPPAAVQSLAVVGAPAMAAAQSLAVVGAPAMAATRPRPGAPAAAQAGLSAHDVTSLSEELRFEQLLRRAPPHLPHAMRGDFGKLLDSAMRVTTVGVLAVWGKSHALGMAFIVDSLLAVTKVALYGAELFGAAEKLHRAIRYALEAREEQDLELAAKLLGDVVAVLDVHGFIALIAHGATRVVSSPMPGKRAERPRPVRQEKGETPSNLRSTGIRKPQANTTPATASKTEKAKPVAQKELLQRIKSGNSKIKIDPAASPEFQKTTLEALDRLAQTETGLKLLSALDESEHSTTIEETSGGNKERGSNGTPTVVLFNPEIKKLNGEDWMERDPAIALGHELIHSLHDVSGTTDMRDLEYTDADGTKRKAPGYELQAVGLGPYKDNDITENKLRAEFSEKVTDRRDGNNKPAKEAQRPRY